MSLDPNGGAPLAPGEREVCDDLERKLEEVVVRDPHGGHTTVVVAALEPLTDGMVEELRRRFRAKGWADLRVAHWTGTSYQVVLQVRRPGAG